MKGMNKYEQVWISMNKYDKYEQVWISMNKYEKVWQVLTSMRKFEQVSENMKKYDDSKIWEDLQGSFGKSIHKHI